MKLEIPDYISAIAPYVPGKPIETLEREYGIRDSIKLASNENPLGPSPKAIEAAQACLAKLNRYPDGAGHALLQRLSDHLSEPWALQPAQIVLGNGSDDILGLLARTLLQAGDEVIIPTPSFLMYSIVACSAGAHVTAVPLKDQAIDLAAVLERVSPRTRMIFLCNPNNPTGSIFTRAECNAFMAKLPSRVVVVIDEAYIEFARDAHCAQGLEYLAGDPPVVILRTFSKVYGLAGLRVGYGIMPAPLAELVNRVRMPFNVNSVAQAAACAALDDSAFLQRTITLVHEELDFLFAELSRRGLRCFPTQSNFFLIDVGQAADLVFERLLREGVIVRSMTSYGFPQYIRINVGLHNENERFLSALDRVLRHD
jgi:histidinol-phosphate aminotransferase